jgi:hypothetical protein
MMRNFLLAGTAAVVVGLAASSAFAFPANSPYAIWEPEAVDQGIAPYGGFAGDRRYDAGVPRHREFIEPGLNEGRSAFVEGDPDPYGDQFGWTVQTPEDSTYYSRGR